MENSGEQQAGGTDPGPAMPKKPGPKAKIMDLARYRVGQRVWWVVFRGRGEPALNRAEEWMSREHPWILWRRRVLPWTVPLNPPRAHPADTMAIMMLCGQHPKIEPFRITEVERSEHSGEFIYTGAGGMRMPEGLLFPSKKAARKEVVRIARLFAAWTGSWEAGLEGPPRKA